MQPRRVQRRHVAEPENNDRWKARKITRGVGQLFRRAEKEWPMNAQDLYIRGHVLVLQDVNFSAVDVVVGDRGHGCRFRDASYIKERRERHPDTYCDGEIREDSQREGSGPDRDVGLRESKNYR